MSNLDDATQAALTMLSEAFKHFLAAGHTVEEATRLCELVLKVGMAGHLPGAAKQS